MMDFASDSVSAGEKIDIKIIFSYSVYERLYVVYGFKHDLFPFHVKSLLCFGKMLPDFDSIFCRKAVVFRV